MVIQATLLTPLNDQIGALRMREVMKKMMEIVVSQEDSQLMVLDLMVDGRGEDGTLELR